MDPPTKKKNRTNQLKFTFNDDELALLRGAADLIDLVPYFRAVMLSHAAKKKGLSKGRLRGSTLTASVSPNDGMHPEVTGKAVQLESSASEPKKKRTG